jgi:hypothetical protein
MDRMIGELSFRWARKTVDLVCVCTRSQVLRRAYRLLPYSTSSDAHHTQYSSCLFTAVAHKFVRIAHARRSCLDTITGTKKSKSVVTPIIVHIDPADKACNLAPPSHDLTLSARLLG